MRPRNFPRINPFGLFAFAVVYLVSVLAGESLYGTLSVPSPFWFPDSILLCALLVSRKEQWWVLMLALWPIRLAVGAPPGTPPWFLIVSIANDSLKGLIAAWWLRRLLPQGIHLKTVREYATFLGVAAAAVPLMSALAAAPARHALGDPLVSAGFQWFLGDAVAQVIVTPALLYWCDGLYRRTSERWLELGVWCGGLVGVLYYAFIRPHAAYSPIVLYAPVPFLMWAAARLRPFGTANAIGLVALVSMLSAVKGTGVFSGDPSNQTLMSMQLFLILVAVSALSLAILMTERENRTSELETLLDAAPLPILVANDVNCDDVRANRAGHRLHRAVIREAVSRPAKEFPLRRAARTGESVVGEAFTLTLDNGAEWHLLGNATPLLDEHDMPRGAIGAFLDITELKRAERALRDSEARVRLVADAAPMLIHAQEEERARIARELHDDICQRLAILQIKAERLGQDTPLSPHASRELQSIVGLAAQLSSDTSSLSHRLHPSTLDTLGLVSALKGLCREFSEQFHVDVDFVHHDVPELVATDVRTSVFRIVQEALRNVVKHSGVTAATVELSGNGDQIEVCISDAGAGFEPDDLGGKPGLGLISMRERLRRIGGELVIQSAPSRGTRIRVSAPARLPIAAPPLELPEPT